MFSSVGKQLISITCPYDEVKYNALLMHTGLGWEFVICCKTTPVHSNKWMSKPHFRDKWIQKFNWNNILKCMKIKHYIKS